jgi:hypothetical protein
MCEEETVKINFLIGEEKDRERKQFEIAQRESLILS